ncbi:MAG: hypothetical protein IT261_07465 [Saprospiraceae bacterium]|nr:hypothetical protein [Saprospiraceae bacterium]
MKTTLTLLLTFLSLSSFAQQRFTPATWIQPDGTAKDILIRFGQWETAPTSITYKINESAPEQELFPSQVRALHVKSQSEERYIGRETQVAVFSKDPSATNAVNRIPKSIFLRTLVEGDLSLFQYRDEDRIAHYFIQTDTSWEELIYHTYYADWEQKITRPHTRYQTSLLRATFDCPALAEKIRTQPPGEHAFRQIVMAYHKSPCTGALVFKETRAKGKLRFGLRAGGAFNFNQTGFEYAVPYSGNHTFWQPRLFAGFQYFLPRRNYTRSVMLEASYDQQAYETTDPVPTRITQNYIQAHLSVRRYYTTGEVHPFINGGLVFGAPTESANLSRGWPRDYSPSFQFGISAGAGLRKSRWELETRWLSQQVPGPASKGVTLSLTGLLTLAYWI